MTLNIDRLKIIYTNKTELIIKKTVWGQLLTVVGILLSFCFLWVFFGETNKLGKAELIIVIALFGSSVFGLYKPLKTLISNEHFLFDQVSQTVYKNHTLLAAFSDIESVEIITIGGGEGGDSYLLNLRLKDKTSIQIDDNPNSKEIKKAAGEIAIFTGKEIRKK